MHVEYARVTHDGARVFPPRSPGVNLAGDGDVWYVHDTVVGTLNHVNSTAALVLGACDGVTAVDARVADWAGTAGVEQAVVAADTTSTLDRFVDLGLVGRSDLPEEPAVRVGNTRDGFDGADRTTGGVHAVLDHGVVFRGTDPALIDRIDSYLGTVDPDRRADIVFDVDAQDDGRVQLMTDDEWLFGSEDRLLRQICGVLNEYASRTRQCLALHAGAVRAPDGRVVLVVGDRFAGKTTLVAGFVAIGWGYLGDESIGVRAGSLGAIAYPKPLSIRSPARALLGVADDAPRDVPPELLAPDVERLFGEVGPISAIIETQFRPGAAVEVGAVWGSNAVDLLLGHALNVGGLGDDGLQTVVDVAGSASVLRLRHPGFAAGVSAVIEHLEN